MMNEIEVSLDMVQPDTTRIYLKTRGWGMHIVSECPDKYRSTNVGVVWCVFIAARDTPPAMAVLL